MARFISVVLIFEKLFEQSLMNFDAFMYSISLFLRLLLDVCYNYNIYMLNMFNFKLVKSFLVFGVDSTRTLIRDPF